jgi:hypothetical protein
MSSITRSRRATVGGFLSIFALGALGVCAFVLTTDRTIFVDASEATGIPVAVLLAVTTLQSLVLVAVATAVGLWCAPRVGLRSHLLDWARSGATGATDGLRAEFRPALAGGVAGGLLLLALGVVAPTPASDAPALVGDGLGSLPARLLYGGLTEEILLRWGVLSLVAWLLCRAAGTGRLTARLGGTAVAVSAGLFAAGHLPAAATTYGALTPGVVGYVLVGNTLAGTLFGWLYWRYSLEAAMAAHAGAHLVAVLVAVGLAPLL